MLWAASTILWTRQMAVSSPAAMNLFKTAFCLPFFVILLLLRPETAFDGVSAGSIAVLLASGIIGMSVGDTTYFAALTRIGARRTMLIQITGPLFAAGLSLFAGQDLPGVVGMFGIGLVVTGIYLVLRERPVGIVQPGHATAGILFALTAAFCQALGIVLTKWAMEQVDVYEASAVRSVAGVAGILAIEAARGLLVPTVRGALRPPGLGRVIPATLMGSLLGFFLFQVAIRHAEPAVTAALSGTSPLFVAPLSIVFLGEAMRAGGWIGTILAVAGVVLVMLG
jgi:drug/metabolite transporter (DMT)-like permease